MTTRANVSTAGLTPEQLAFRRGGIGASEIAALAGLSKWATPIEIYERKRGLVTDEVSSYQARIGILGEAVFAGAWAADAGRVVMPVHTLRHPLRPYALATPDFAVYSSGAEFPPLVEAMGRLAIESVAGCERLLQVKSSSWRMRSQWGAPGTDQVPVEYLCQAHWEGAIAGVDEVLIVVDFDKTQLLEYPVRVSLETFDELYAIAERFMVEHVEAGVPPEPDGSAAWADFVERAHPKAAKRDARPEVHHLDADAVSRAIVTLAEVAHAEKRVKALRTLAENVVKAAIAEGTGLSGDWGKITWLENRPNIDTDWKGYARELANVVALLLQSHGAVTAAERAELVELVKGLEAKHTTTKPGPRVLRKTWKAGGPLDLSAKTINLRLEKPASILDEAAPTEEGTNE